MSGGSLVDKHRDSPPNARGGGAGMAILHLRVKSSVYIRRFMTETGNLERLRIEFDLPLKGDRTYLQSANILQEFLSRFSITGAVKLDFRQMIYHPIYLASDAPENPDRVGKFAFREGDGWITYGIFTDSTRQIEKRIPDNEKEILEASSIHDDRAAGPIDEPGSFIDTIVALNKVLVGRHANGKKAIFTNIELGVIPDRGRIGVALIKRLGSKIFVSDVLWNDARIGSLTFMTR
jgi:hypothetical protein